MSILSQSLADGPADDDDPVRAYIRANMSEWLAFAHSLNVGIAAEDILLVRGCYAPPSAAQVSSSPAPPPADPARYALVYHRPQLRPNLSVDLELHPVLLHV
jgi:hypothetical protein